MFPKPARKEDLKNIESIPLKDMKKEFQEEMSRFKDHVLKNPDVKMMYGQPLTG